MNIEQLETLISDNKEIFFSELKQVIKPNFTGLDNPEKYSDIIFNITSKGGRDSFPRQARLVAAATQYITAKNNKSLLVSSEMGTGKCILPKSHVVVDGKVLTIEDVYRIYADHSSEIVDDENPYASWFLTNKKLQAPSYCEKTRSIVDKEIKHIYRQKVSENIRKITTHGNY